MNLLNTIWNTVIINPFVNLFVAVYQGLQMLHIPYGFGFTIILLTVLIKYLLFPLVTAQLKAQKQLQEVQPEMNKIKQKYKNDAKRQQLEMMALYRTKGINPAAGCFPSLIQMPFLIGLYSTLFKLVHVKHVNEVNSLLYTNSLHLDKLWSYSFFGIPLNMTPAELFSTVGLVVLLVGLLTAFFQFIQSKMMMAPSASLPKKNSGEEDFSAIFQKQTVYLLPVMIGYFAHILPIGLSFYWNTYTIFGIIQQYKTQGIGGLADWIQKFKKK